MVHDVAFDFEAARIDGMIVRPGEEPVAEFFDRRDDFHDLWMVFPKSESGSVFRTSHASSHPRRAINTPNGMLLPRCLVWCASVEMANFATSAFAVRTIAPP